MALFSSSSSPGRPGGGLDTVARVRRHAIDGCGVLDVPCISDGSEHLLREVEWSVAVGSEGRRPLPSRDLRAGEAGRGSGIKLMWRASGALGEVSDVVGEALGA